MPGDAAHDVRFEAILAAAARAVRAAWPAFLIAWAARTGLEALTPVLRAEVNASTGYATRSFTALPWVTGLVVAAVSGLYMRWLLDPRRSSLRLDLGLVVYVILIEASRAAEAGCIWLIRPIGGHAAALSSLALRSSLMVTITLVCGVVFSAMALWPIALLMADRLSLPQAVRRMSPMLLCSWSIVPDTPLRAARFRAAVRCGGG